MPPCQQARAGRIVDFPNTYSTASPLRKPPTPFISQHSDPLATQCPPSPTCITPNSPHPSLHTTSPYSVTCTRLPRRNGAIFGGRRPHSGGRACNRMVIQCHWANALRCEQRRHAVASCPALHRTGACHQGRTPSGRPRTRDKPR